MAARDDSPPRAQAPAAVPSAAAHDLAALLKRLKADSGRTYDGLTKRTGISRSSVHRYLHALSVPDSFGPVEALARACSANSTQIAELFRLWSVARSPVDATGTGGGDHPSAFLPQSPPVAEPVPAPEPFTTSDPASGAEERNARRGRVVTGLLSVAAVLAVLLAARSLLDARFGWGEGGPRVRSDAPQVLGPDWMQVPQPVRDDFFGVTINSQSGRMPGFRVGAVRLWDSSTNWSDLEPERGRYDWSILDRLVTGARRAGHPILLTFGATPQWASPNGPRTAYPNGSRASPPDDLADWDDFVRAVTTRYRGKIDAYELWVLAPSSLYYSGTPATLAAMTERAARVLERTDPQATVVCPSMGELWKAESRQFLVDFAALGGYDHCDVAGVKLHPRDFREPPETIAELTDLIDKTFHRAGLHIRTWSTGTTYRIASADHLDEVTARNYAVRLYLMSLHARYERMYFYNWGGRKIPIALQAEGGPPTEAALAVQRLQSWLRTARIYACGHGRDDALPENVWRCRFQVGPDVIATPADSEILWAATGSARVQVDRDGVRHFLDGHTTAVKEGQAITIDGEPTRIVYAKPRV